MEQSLPGIFKLPTFIGSFPFTFDFNDVRIDRKRFALSIFVNVVIGVMMIFHLKEVEHFFKGEPPLYLIYITVYMIVEFVAVNYFLFHVSFRKKRFHSLLNKLLKVDRTFSELNTKPCAVDDRVAVYALLLLTPCQTILRFSVNHDYFQVIIVTYLEWSMLLLVLPFVEILHLLKKRFIAVKDLLKLPAKTTCKNRCRELKRLEDAVSLFDLLCSASKELNSYFSFQLLFYFFLTINIIVWFIYHTALSISLGNTSGIVIKCIVMAKYSILYYLIITVSHETTSEAKEFNTLLYQLMIDDKTNDISNNKKLRLHIAMKREVVFTACGFFTLDYTLVHSMIAAATTYLVILIQFGQPTASTPVQDTTTLFINTTDVPLANTSGT